MTGSDDESPPDDAGTAESTGHEAAGADAPPDGEFASASDGGTVTAEDAPPSGDGPVPPSPEDGAGGVDDLPAAEDEPGDDDLSPRSAMIFGGVMVVFGGWLGLSGGGYCLALFDTCLVSAPVFGFLVFAFGALSLWAGWDARRKGEETV